MAFGITDIDGDGKLSFDEFLFAAILLGTFSQVPTCLSESLLS
jgi:hypothetical protein